MSLLAYNLTFFVSCTYMMLLSLHIDLTLLRTNCLDVATYTSCTVHVIIPVHHQ